MPRVTIDDVAARGSCACYSSREARRVASKLKRRFAIDSKIRKPSYLTAS